MAENISSRLDELREKLGLLRKTTETKKKAEKRTKKTKKRKLEKKKHKKQKMKKQETKKVKRLRQRERKLKKLQLKKQRREKHKTRKQQILRKKYTEKAEEEKELTKELPQPETPAVKETVEEATGKELPEVGPREETEFEENTWPEEDEINETEIKENDEVERTDEVERAQVEEYPEPESKPKQAEQTKKQSLLPFRIKVNVPGKESKREKKGRDLKKMLIETAEKEAEREGKSPIEVSHEMIKQLIVADVMSTDPITVHATDKLSYVVRLFSSKKISGAPVISDHSVVGIITKSDIIKVIGVKDLLNIDTAGLEKLEDYKVADVMRKKVHHVTRYAKISDAADTMNKNDINLLPVVDDKKRIIGIVSRGDIVRVVSKELLTKMLRERRQAVKKMTKIETDIDSVLEMVEKEGSINILEITERLRVPEEKVEEWAKIMEKEGLIEIYYPAFGSPVLRKKLKKEARVFEEEEES